jgi:hypothetical protein
MPQHSIGLAGPHGWDQVAERAARDAGFRSALLDDPARALRETLGITLPPDYRIRFVERPRDLDALVVLPDLRHERDDELTDDELDEAAGGDGTWSDTSTPPPPTTTTTP